MTWLLSLLGREKFLLEVVDLVRDLLVEENNNKRWTKLSEIIPPEKRMLVFRDKGGYYVGHCEVGESSIRVGKYGKFEVAIIPEKAYDHCFWMELGDPTGHYDNELRFCNISNSKYVLKERRCEEV